MSKTRFYDLLGISKNASSIQIKKAFRKAAMKEHPDKGGDEEKFKEIAKAYEILSDPEKKNIYDKFGEDGLKHQGVNFSSPTDIFSMFFGANPFTGQSTQKRTKNIVYPLKVTLEDIYRGKKTKVKITRRRVKYPPHISRNNALVECKYCEGKGVVTSVSSIGLGFMRQNRSPCTKCQGQGNYMRKGITTYDEEKIIKINIKKGIKNGTQFIFKEEADEEPGKKPSDIIFEIVLLPHSKFKRENDDLYTSYNINIWKALLNKNIKITLLGGEQILVRYHKVIKHGHVLCLKNKGITSSGNLYIEFKIDFPEILTNSQKIILNDFINNDENNDELEICDLIEFIPDTSKKQPNYNSTHPNVQGVQCAQQ